MKSNVGFVRSDIFLRHNPDLSHPESPDRLRAIDRHFQSVGLAPKLVPIAAREASTETIELVHAASYVRLAQKEILSGRPMLSTGDTNVSAGSWDAALHAAGGCIAAVDAIMSNQIQRAFCAVRPPGHHATPSAGMGFCIFNNAAIAARYAQRRHGIKRVLIVDWDLHHGNGTQDAFYEDPTVFFLSTHEDGVYPMDFTGHGGADETGIGAGKGFTMNRPLAPGSGDTEIISIYMNELLPATSQFAPELIIISAGFDSRVGDPLGQLRITDNGFRNLTSILKTIAAPAGQGRILSVLEGGYDLLGLSSAAAAHVEELLLP